jgi:hypothetical protein
VLLHEAVLPAAPPPDSPLVVVRAEELSDVEGDGGNLRPRQGPPPPREDGGPRDAATSPAMASLPKMSSRTSSGSPLILSTSSVTMSTGSSAIAAPSVI